MSRTIKILHIDPEYEVTYFVYRPGSTIRSSVPLETAINLLKTEDFDLILSEPHQKAILKDQPPSVKSGPALSVEQLSKEDFHGDLWQVRPN